MGIEQGVREIAEEVYCHLDGEEIADLALQLSNIHGPEGHEQQVGEAVFQWMNANHISGKKLLVAGTRFDVLGTLSGIGGGRNLAFNAHMDTLLRYLGEAQSGVEDMDGYRAWRQGDRLFGLAVLNDRGCLATFLVAAKAIQKSGIRLRGDVVLTAVVGEIGAAPIEQYQGPEYLGKGIGTRHAIAYGPQVDYALVCETTDFGIGWVQCGVAYIKITVTGEGFYTPRTRPVPGMSASENPNAIVKMSKIIEAVTDWANNYPHRHALDTPCGTVRPKVNIGAIRGGAPPHPSETAASCSIYVDVWRAPGVPLRETLQELRLVLDATGLAATMEVYLQRNGYVGEGVEPLAKAVSCAYQELVGANPPAVSEDVLSMWRDTNVYNECAIPAVTFGPTRHKLVRATDDPAAKHNKVIRYLTIPDMVLAAKVYVKTALDICGVAGKSTTRT
jgi:acetylornithine deacetylase/succinyl-diaminopimelate desuccinylase-like protein